MAEYRVHYEVWDPRTFNVVGPVFVDVLDAFQLCLQRGFILGWVVADEYGNKVDSQVLYRPEHDGSHHTLVDQGTREDTMKVDERCYAREGDGRCPSTADGYVETKVAGVTVHVPLCQTHRILAMVLPDWPYRTLIFDAEQPHG